MRRYGNELSYGARYRTSLHRPAAISASSRQRSTVLGSSPPASWCRWLPEAIDRASVDAIFEPPGILACGEYDAGPELVAKQFTQQPESPGILADRLGSGFHFETHDSRSS